MAQKKEVHTTLILTISVITALLLLVFMFAKSSMKKSASFRFDGGASSLTKESQFTVDVYLDSEKGEEITAYDIQIDYDKTKAKLIAAEPAGYLTSPLTVKWDLENAWFAASANPSSYKDTISRINPDKPMVTLTFIALDSTNSSTISLKKESEVYVSQKGGMSASKAQYHFSVK